MRCHPKKQKLSQECGTLAQVRLEDVPGVLAVDGLDLKIMPGEVRAVAGGEWRASASPPSCTPQDLPERTIGASYGDALLAARSVGPAKPDTGWSSISETVEPEAENREIYDELYRIYRGLYPATREASHALADLQKGGAHVVT
jgi:hypothetical protein